MPDSAAETVTVKKQAWERLQDLYDLLGYEDEIIWDAFKPNQKEELRKKIMLVVGVEEKPDYKVILKEIEDENEKEKEKEKAEKIRKKNMELVEKLCETIWRQAKYLGGTLNMAISYVCIVPEESNTLAIAPLSTDFFITPIFRIMKCVKSEDSTSARGCCMIFVDINARVYANWEAYCNENTLPAGIVVAPRKGIFMGEKKNDDEWVIQLDKFLSPAAKPQHKVASGLDTTSSVVGVTASVVLLGAVAAPVLLPLAGGAAIAGGISSAWSLFRSGQQLSDRNNHEQSISVTDAEARGSWLGVAGGTLGFASGAAGKMVSSMARSGSTLSPFVAYSVNTLNVSTLLVNGAGTLNGVVDVFIIDDEPVTPLKFAQLSASLFMFTHSVYNFQTANNLFKNHQDMTMKKAMDNLSRNQKRAFNKMAKETIRLKGNTAGKADIIRSLNKIDDPKGYFRDMYKINKQLNQANVKVSFNGEASPVLNSQTSNAMPNEIRANLRAAAPNQVFQDVTPHDRTLGAPTPGQLNITSISNPAVWTSTAIATLRTLPHLIGEDTKATLLNIAQLLNKTLFEKFVTFVKHFICEFGQEIAQSMRRTLCIEEYLQTIFLLLDMKAKELELTIHDMIEELRDGRDQNKAVKAEIMRYYRGQALDVPPVPNKHCNVCGGKYYEKMV